jgi:biotin transport system ATP-binding protein
VSRVELRDVTVRLPTSEGDVLVLDRTSLTLTEQRIALVGGNGSGKSTLARLVNGLVTATTGQVLVDGLDVAEEGAAVRRKVGFCFTDPAAQLVMPTVVEDVALSLRRQVRDKDERRAAAVRVLEQYGLADLADRSVHSLSGGQRQLLALAGVLATRPDVLVADEPTTLLDLRNTRDVAARLAALTQDVVLVTHDLDLVAAYDRVLVVDDGRVVVDDVPAVAVPAYRALMEVPA